MKLIISLVFMFFSLQAFACEVKDDLGNTISFKKSPERIIVLSPDLVEILFSIQAENKIVGVMQGSDFPEQARRIPIVATYNHIDREKILLLKPDLIITWKDVSFLSSLSQFHVPVYVSNPKKITDISQTMKNLGCLTSEENLAQEQALNFENKYLSLKNKYSHLKKINIFYQVWPKPLMTISKNNWINQIITDCGGENIFSNLKVPAPMVSVEAVLEKNPDVIVGESLQIWENFPTLNAVSKKHLYQVDTDLLERPGPRILEGMKQLCSLLDKARNDN